MESIFDLSDEMKDESSTLANKQRLISVLNIQLDQFKEITSAGTTSDLSQQQQRLQRQVTATILNSVQDLVLLPLNSFFQKYGESSLNAVDEIKEALTILIDKWGMGDAQVYSALVDALIRSYAAASARCDNEIQGIESLQNFVLLDLLPYVINGDTENCHLAQSFVAKALLQTISSCTKDFILSPPIINWCRFQLDNMYFQHQRSTIHNVPFVSTAPLKFVLPPELHELGLVLLRNVHSPDILPSSARIVLDHFSVMASCNALNGTLLLQNATKAVVCLRQRLINFSEGKEEDEVLSRKENQLKWQLHLARVVVIALADEASNQSEWLAMAYLQQLMLIVEKKLPQTPSNMRKKEEANYVNNCSVKTCRSEHADIRPTFLALDWIVIIFLLSTSSSLSSKNCALLFMICDSLRELDKDSKAYFSYSVYEPLCIATEVILLRDLEFGTDNNYKFSITAEELPAIAFDTLENGNIQHELASGLLSLAMVLLLGPTQVDSLQTVEFMSFVDDEPFSATMNADENFLSPNGLISIQSWVHDFILQLYVRLDSRRQEELVHMLLYSVDETILRLKRCTTSENGSKSSYPSSGSWSRKRKNRTFSGYRFSSTATLARDDEKVVILRSVFSTIHCLAKKSPKGFTCFKDELIQRLLSTSLDGKAYLNDAVVRPICIILLAFMSTPESISDTDTNPSVRDDESFTCPEVLLLIQKLLFGEPTRGETSRVVRGVTLAAELISTRSGFVLSMENRNCIQEWVLRCLLPPTRRMVDPELGLPGLLFLQAWIDWNDRNNGNLANEIVFHHFKMIVANTGLIQMIDSFQASGNKNPSSLLGYSSSVPPSENLERDPVDRDRPRSRAMLFAVFFFLRHAGDIESCPFRWSHATDWVFSLIDKYLHMGRTKASKNWQPNNWLLASLEFPLIDTSLFKRSVEAQNLVIEWVDDKLCHFDISHGIQPVSNLPATFADTIVRCLSSKKLRYFIDSVSCLSLALLIGMSLSAAVLRNAVEHTRTSEAESRSLQPLLKLQIAKIYDLRAKSLTVDSCLVAVGSAFRRSLLRKKRAAVVLSDDSSDDSDAAVPVASVRNIQDNKLLAHLSNILAQTHGLRFAIFTSLKMIRYDIIWEAIEDVADCNTFHSSLNAILSRRDLHPSEESYMNLLRMLDMKLNLLQHIIEQMENSSLADLAVTESFASHCMKENCFLLDVSIKLRKSCLDTQNVQNETFNMKQKLLTNITAVTSSYLHVFGLILKRSYFLGLTERKLSLRMQGGVTFNRILNWCDGCLAHRKSQTSSTPLLRLFEFFSAQLSAAENFVVAYYILEILFIFALSDDDGLLRNVVELSWTSLHTVYIGTEVTEKTCYPFAVTMLCRRLSGNLSMTERHPILRIVNRILSRLRQRTASEFQFLELGLIRHWGLLTSSEDCLSLLIRHLSTLISSLKSLLESLDVALFAKKDDDEKKHETILQKKQKACHTSPIFGLEVATISEYFDTLLYLVVATTGIVSPGEQLSCSRSSPYHLIQECFGLFRNLIETYQGSMFAFPRRSVATVTCASKDILAIAFYQLQCCIDWRNQQPLLSIQERASGQLDIGSIRYLQQLIDTTLSHTAVPILELCDAWQSSTVVGFMKVSRISTIRLVVEKAMQRIKDVALSHNLSTSFSIKYEGLETVEPTKGFHLLTRTHDYVEQQSVCSHASEAYETDEPIAFKRLKVDFEKSSDTDDSFGVMGHWGDESEFNGDDNSACTLNLDNLSASLPRKSL